MLASSRSGRGAIVVLVLATVVLSAVGAVAGYMLTEPRPMVGESGDVAGLQAQVEEMRLEMDRLQEEVRQLRTAPLQVASRSLESDPEPREARGGDDEESGRGDRGDRGDREEGRRDDFGRRGFDPDVRKLEELEDDQERLALALEMIESDNPMSRMAALEVLVELSPAEAVKAVEQMMEDYGDDRRGGWMTARAIGELADAQGVSADLYRIYESATGDAQLAAARALSKQGDNTLMDRHMSTILPSLASADGGVQLRAIDELGDTRSSAAVPHLTPYLSNSNSEVRLRTLDALRRTGDENVLVLIEPLLNDPIAQVRSRAERVMEDIRDGDDGDDWFGGRGRGGRGGR